jgi:hypothetical protein
LFECFEFGEESLAAFGLGKDWQSVDEVPSDIV